MQWKLLGGAIVAVAMSCTAVRGESGAAGSTIGGVPCTAARVGSASALLERGVYLEETAGDLDAAIQAYQKVIIEVEASRPAVAEALYRLGVCQMKKKQSSEAAQTFQQVITQYSDQGVQMARARQKLVELSAPARQQAVDAILADPEPIVKKTGAIFEAIRTADYDRWLNGEGWQSFPLTRHYQTYQWYDALVPWICRTFKADPIRDVTLGKVFKNEDGLPAVPYKLTLASGKVMEGVLPFNLNDGGEWYARWGLDWHLGKRMRVIEARKSVAPAGVPAKVQMRLIGKAVSAFTEGDLSTPESAAGNYYLASGRMNAEALAAVSVSPIDPDMFKGMQKQMNPKELEGWNKAQLTAMVLQVLTYRENLAMVITKLNFPPGVGSRPFSGRQFGLIDGKWKNLGEDRYPTPGAAQAAFEKHKDAAWDDYQQTAGDSEPVNGSVNPGSGNGQAAKPAADMSGAESTIRGFHAAAAAGNISLAMSYVLPGGLDYEDVNRILTGSSPEDSDRQFAAMLKSLDPQDPVQVTKASAQGDTAKILYRVKFAKEWSVRQKDEAAVLKPGDTFEVDATLKKLGDKWLIDNM